MYQYIQGVLAEKTATALMLEVGGIGYQLQIPVSTFSALPAVGSSVRLWTHFVVREDAHSLYGFLTEEERQLFRSLVSVSGIGPKTALAALSGIPIQDLKRAIIDGNLVVLTGVSGIGRKTAERMVVELREKIVVEDTMSGAAAGSKSDSPVAEDSLRALIELGYKKQSAQEAVQKALRQFDGGKVSLPDLIRASLRYV